MVSINQLAIQVIELFQQHIAELGFVAQVHFELEGCCKFSDNQQLQQHHFDYINQQLSDADIQAQVISEYWQNQWEYVSTFSGQSPLKEADNLAKALHLLPKLFHQLGVNQTLIKPVVWSGDNGQLALGSKNIFTHNRRAVHIPNAIQINVSVLDSDGNNLVAIGNFGELLQRCFLDTSLDNCLLYLPEPEAFERLALKTRYGLAQELCSPVDISGGHQGSIALYKQQGKHNQLMGVDVMLVDQHNQPLITHHNWQKTARVEHRLGASSRYYNAFINVAFALANIIDALELYLADKAEQVLALPFTVQTLPENMFGDINGHNAMALFKKSHWLANRIDQSADNIRNDQQHKSLGQALKQSLINSYQ
ncbi:hypothetical protein [Colwellia sp. MEBiC06753]